MSLISDKLNLTLLRMNFNCQLICCKKTHVFLVQNGRKDKKKSL